MATKQRAFRRVESILGCVLLVIGVIFLSNNVDAMLASAGPAAGHAQDDTTSALLGFGLAGLHAVQAYSFDRAHFFSALHGILVSFWPLALVLIGVVLMRDFFALCVAAYRTRARS